MLRDPRTEIWLYGDESGTFDFSGRPDDRYFLIVTVAIPDQRLIDELDGLAAQIRAVVGDEGLARPFHAKDDTPLTKDQVFALLAKHNLAIDATIVEKTQVAQSLKSYRQTFYELMWFQHLVHVVPGILYPANKVRLFVAQLGDRSKARSFRNAYVEATAFAYVPLLLKGTKKGMAEMTQEDWFRVSAFLFTQVDAEGDPLMQVADYCAWAIHRKLERKEDRWYGQIRHLIRSERLLVLEDKIPSRRRNESVLIGRMSMSGVKGAHHNYSVMSSYRIGPADSFQAYLAFQQAIEEESMSKALSFLEAIQFAEVFDEDFERFVGLIALLVEAVATDPELATRASRVLGNAARVLLSDFDSEPHLDMLGEAVSLSARALDALQGQIEPGLHTAEAIVALCEHVLCRVPGDPVASVLLANAMYNRALKLATISQGDALAAYSEVIDRFRDSCELPIGSVVAKALVNKGNLLRASGHRIEALDCYRQVIDSYATQTFPGFEEPVLKAYINAWQTYSESGEAGQMLELIANSRGRFARTTNLSLRRDAAESLWKQARLLAWSGLKTGAIGVLEQFQQWYARETDPVLLEIRIRSDGIRRSLLREKGVVGAVDELKALERDLDVIESRNDGELRILRAHALGAKLNVLIELDRNDEALALSEEVLQACRDLPEESVRPTVGQSLVNQAIGLAKLDRLEESIDAFGRVLVEFGDIDDPDLASIHTQAHAGMAHVYSRGGENDKALACLSRIVDEHSGTPEPWARDALIWALGNRVLLHESIGNRAAANADMIQLERRLGKAEAANCINMLQEEEKRS